MAFAFLPPDGRILLVGPGGMGVEYARTLLHLGVAPEQVTVVGRRLDATAAFVARFPGMAARAGGFEALDGTAAAPAVEAAIIAVPPAGLAAAARAVMNAGVRRILLEKPGALSATVMAELAGEAERRGVDLFLAYNRRFLPSVRRVREMIAEDGGVLAAAFDFSELEGRILEDPTVASWGPAVLDRWGVINPSHVIDLFVHLAGFPADWIHHRAGSLPWHPAGALFWGAGITERAIPFVYLSTWNAAGRWGVEVTTPRHKIILRPLEAPMIQERSGFAQSPLTSVDEPGDLKPGFPGLIQAFLDGGPEARFLCTAGHAASLLKLIETMFGYAGQSASPIS
jgi:predicted dehydrogenase